MFPCKINSAFSQKRLFDNHLISAEQFSSSPTTVKADPRTKQIHIILPLQHVKKTNKEKCEPLSKRKFTEAYITLISQVRKHETEVEAKSYPSGAVDLICLNISIANIAYARDQGPGSVATGRPKITFTYHILDIQPHNPGDLGFDAGPEDGLTPTGTFRDVVTLL